VTASDEEEPMTTALSPSGLGLPNRQDWTVDDLADLPKDLRYELVDGRLVVPSPTPFHQSLGNKVANALEVYCPADVFVSTDTSVAINSRNEPRPDVVVLGLEVAGRSPVPVRDVILAVEIISPESTIWDWTQKTKLYASAGVPSYWVIDPTRERVTLTEFRLRDGGDYRAGFETDGLVTLDRPWEVTLNLPVWTERRNKVRDSARSKD
jgi:Uma2 family endonuclease